MQSVSQTVLGTAAELARDAYSEGELETLFVQVGLGQFTPNSWYGKAKLISGTIRPATKRAAQGDSAVAESLAKFVIRVAERLGKRPDAEDEGSPFFQLREALRADGLDARLDLDSVNDDQWTERPRVLRVRILPLDDPNVSLSETITALEDDLRKLDLNVANNCYRQAVDALVERRYESANAQIRALFEEVAVQAAATVGFVRTKQGDGGRAIGYLIQGGHLPGNGAGKFIEGLWAMTHTNGPHPGTTTAGEARFRLQAITSAARYLVDRFFSEELAAKGIRGLLPPD